jgi:hypothetical protein
MLVQAGTGRFSRARAGGWSRCCAGRASPSTSYPANSILRTTVSGHTSQRSSATGSSGRAGW